MSENICSIDGCPNLVCAKQLCRMHYMRVVRGIDLNAPKPTERYPKICMYPGCDKPAPAKGLCHAHYRQEWPQENDAANAKIRAQKMREFLGNLKVEMGCSICDYNRFSGSLHFDHLDPTQKRFCVGTSAPRGINTVMTEIEKCELLCVNCHSIRTQTRRESTKTYSPKIMILRDEINSLKLEKGCFDCGYRENVWALQFDHIDPNLKIAAVSTLVYRGKVSSVWEEVAKCDIRCGNCHMEKTFEGKGILNPNFLLGMKNGY